MDILTMHLCQIQAHLFELSVIKGYDSEKFIKTYMTSDIANRFNSSYDSIQWRGEEYILSYLEDDYNLQIGKTYTKDEMFWIGYIYCYWHFKTNETCMTIYNTASASVMKSTYDGFHTIDNDLAVENLIELYLNKNIKKLNNNTFKFILRNDIEQLLNTRNNQKFEISFVNNEELNNFVNKTKNTFVNEILDLIDRSTWPLRKKAEYKTIINILYDDIINNRYNDQIHDFLIKTYYNLTI